MLLRKTDQQENVAVADRHDLRHVRDARTIAGKEEKDDGRSRDPECTATCAPGTCRTTKFRATTDVEHNYFFIRGRQRDDYLFLY